MTARLDNSIEHSTEDSAVVSIEPSIVDNNDLNAEPSADANNGPNADANNVVNNVDNASKHLASSRLANNDGMSHNRVSMDDIRDVFIDYGDAGVGCRNETEKTHVNAAAFDECLRAHDRDLLQLPADDIVQFILATGVKGLTIADVRRGLRGIFDPKL